VLWASARGTVPSWQALGRHYGGHGAHEDLGTWLGFGWVEEITVEEKERKSILQMQLPECQD
jgi:hypothetical protein